MKITSGSFNASLNSVAGEAKELPINTSLEADNVEDAINELDDKTELIRSHIGMIIQTTTLDTEEKVKAIYGGSAWSKIEGQFLLGTSSKHAVNSTGGSEDAIIPYHNHSISSFKTTDGAGNHTHGLSNAYANTPGTGPTGAACYNSPTQTNWYYNYLTGTGAAGAHNHTIPGHNTNYAGTSGNAAGANMPPFKTVYIWERTA